MLNISALYPNIRLEIQNPPDRLSSETEEKVSALWHAAQHKGGTTLFDGEILSLLTVAPDRITAFKTTYKYWFAQKKDPALFETLHIQPLAVSGILECADGFVFGKRTHHMQQEAGLWELVPSGGLDSKDMQTGDLTSPLPQIFAELHEETGLSASVLTEITPFCLIEDKVTHVFDIGIFLGAPALSFADIQNPHKKTAYEYDLLECVPEHRLAAFIKQAHADIVPVSLALLGRVDNYRLLACK